MTIAFRPSLTGVQPQRTGFAQRSGLARPLSLPAQEDAVRFGVSRKSIALGTLISALFLGNFGWNYSTSTSVSQLKEQVGVLQRDKDKLLMEKLVDALNTLEDGQRNNHQFILDKIDELVDLDVKHSTILFTSLYFPDSPEMLNKLLERANALPDSHKSKAATVSALTNQLNNGNGACTVKMPLLVIPPVQIEKERLQRSTFFTVPTCKDTVEQQ